MRSLAAALSAAGLLLAAAAPAVAATLKVPSEEYPNIQAAVTAAQDGDTVLVASGIYAEDVLIASKSNLRIRGKGMPVLQPSSVAFTITNGSVVEVSGFRVEGGAGAVLVQTSSGVKLTKIVSAQSSDESFAFEMCAGVLLSKCEAYPANSEAVVDISSSGLVIEKCFFAPTVFPTVVDLSSQAGGSAGSNGAVVTKNRFASGGVAIAFGGTGGRIEKNTIEGSNGIAILLPGVTDTAGTVVSRNRIATNGSSGIESYSPLVTIERNSLRNGRLVAQGDGVILDRNEVDFVDGTAISTAGNGVTVTRNHIEAPSGVGLDLAGGVHTVEGNTVLGPDGGGIHLGGGTGGSSLRWNQIKGSDAIGILVLSTPVTVVGNKSTLNGFADYADVNAEGVNTLTGNRFGVTIFNYSE